MAVTYTKLFSRHILMAETVAVADSAGAIVVTVNGTTLSHWMEISNKTIGVTGEITEVSAGDGAIDFRLEGSIDDATWDVVDASAGIDLDPTGLNTASGSLVATGFYYPYWRIVAFTDGTDTLDASALTMTVAAPFYNNGKTPLRRAGLS